MLILSQKIGEWPDPSTPPQSTTECSNYASGDLPLGGRWKTCIGWTTTWRHIAVEAFLDFNGPDDITDDARAALNQCALVGATAAGIAAIATDGAGAAQAAQTAFIACMKVKGVAELDKYNVTFRTQTHWVDGI